MTRPPVIRAAFDGPLFPGELVIDGFAGGGGASSGIEDEIRRHVDIAINHSAEAIAMHKANHPNTQHYLQNIWEVDPAEACAGRAVGLAWFSPDCTFFSRAKGTKPLSKKNRSLAWVAVRWAKAVRPRIMVVENVPEFEQWGPLANDNRPIKAKAGRTFRRWVAQLRNLGYQVEHRALVAADYGTPTTRKRLFIIARCDGQPICWPEPTHGKGRAQPWVPASHVIDWSLGVRSIFGRKKPLAEATLMRIAKGIQRYVMGRSEPFIIPLTHQGDARVHSIAEPVRTITGANRGELALVDPFVVRHGHYSHKTGAGLREGCGAGTFRGQPLDQPLATVCATNDKHLVCPIITKHYGGVVGHECESTLGTVTARDHHALTAAFLAKFYGTSHSSSMQLPLPTVTANGRGGGHLAEVRAFLIKYYKAGGRAQQQELFEPLHTITTRARFGLVTIHGEQYEIVDIGMRMLAPHELFAAQGFRPDYNIAPTFNGKPLTKTKQIELCGNSVCRHVAAAIVRANVREQRGVAA